jgi:hypothetical protein
MKSRLCQIMNGTSDSLRQRKGACKAVGCGLYPQHQVLHSDNRKRVTLPDPARPKDSWIPEVIGPNQIVLTRVEKPARPRAKLVRKNGHLLLSSKRPISWEETRKAMDEFP